MSSSPVSAIGDAATDLSKHLRRENCGIAALAGAIPNYLFKKTILVERWLLILAGLALVYPKAMFDYIGLALLATVILSQSLRKTVAQPVMR